MRRFFIAPDSLAGNQITLTGSEARHVASVLRLSPGTEIELFDGAGAIHLARIRRVSPAAVELELIATRHDDNDASPQLILALGLLKGKKMDLVIQKATELGVHAIQPLITRYSEKRGVRDRQLERWQRIMLEACKQCKRPIPMLLQPVLDLTDFTPPSSAVKLMFWEQEQKNAIPASLLPGPEPICLLVGPEGGFHEGEARWAAQHEFQILSMGPRILRAETAAISAVVIAQLLVGGFRPPCL